MESTAEGLVKKLKKEERPREKELKKLKKQHRRCLPQQQKKMKKIAIKGLEVDPETPLGEKKKLAPEMAQNYNPSDVLPPPNVTGDLHLGHALTVAIEDTIIRWKQMSAYNTVWVPGMDHAGIATQVAVEKKIWKDQKLTRHDLGRERFLDESFTMDVKRSRAVTEAFVRLHKEGLIYRDERLVSWDCSMQTAISNVELKDTNITERTPLQVKGYEAPVEFGVLTLFAYPLEGDLGEIVVATTPVETMLGDTAIAVHPKDPRYKHLHGKFAVHPFNGRKLKIVCDSMLVDMKFGTGAVKITPAHDPDDYEVGKRHDLDCITLFTDDGKINSNGGEVFEGMPRFKARVTVIQALKEKLYLQHRGDKNNEMCLKICSRSNDVVEYLVKPQWYVNCKGMAEDGLNAVIGDTNPKLEIEPKQYVAEWQRWLENIRDWCISRQIWWGHRIPTWYVVLEDDQLKELDAYDNRWVVGRTVEEAQEEASRLFAGKKVQLLQDPDVLDTWFSSGLFPVSVFGWPDDTEDLKAFSPTSVLETGHDILFFWVARMVMMCMKLGGDLPFTKVYLHPMVRDSHRCKMSEELGNGIDPLDIINGATLEELHEKLDKRHKEGSLTLEAVEIAKERQSKDFPNGIKELSGAISCGMQLVASLESYEFSDAATAVYSWWKYQLCDVFIEDTLWLCLDNGLRLLHPFMPFITEELWQRLPYSVRKESISISEYPSVIKSWTNDDVELEMDMIDSVVKSLRSLKSQLPPKVRPAATVRCLTNDACDIIKGHGLEIATLAKLSSLTVLSENADVPVGYLVDVVNESLSVFLEQGSINAEAELGKLKEKMKETQKQIDSLTKMTSAAGYKEKASPDVCVRDEEKLASLLREIPSLKEAASEHSNPNFYVWRVNF
ncbi:hypothetical protein SASPL_155208 [Salvia splendens]|uniref:valine--tRNA ligase n=1 Tax=Salvia splendens TaxID=180675 RepID=A0A8X8W1L0_SALSN|nr:hypothetical protein SASPL_155208 [Salvia splendens]